MKRALAAVVSAAVLLSMLPGLTAAAKPSEFTEMHVLLSCDGPEGFVFIDLSSEFGGFAEAAVWFDDATPDEDPPTASGSTDAIDVVEGDTEAEISFDFTAFGPDGDELGEGSFAANLTVVGESTDPDPLPDRNQQTRIEILRRSVEGDGTLTVPGGEAQMSCSGVVTHRTVWQTNPTSFVERRSTVLLDCVWETESYFASLSAFDLGFGFDLGVNFFSQERELFSVGNFTGSLDASGLEGSVELIDPLAGDSETATVSATFEPVGDPVTSFAREQEGLTKVVEQLLSVDGTLEFSTDLSLELDDEACTALAQDFHTRFNGAKGPKNTGPAPVNDTLEGAVELAVGDSLNVRTTGTAMEPEVPGELCGFFDGFGHTVWYTFEGTGEAVTIDTAGSGIDTVLSVYRVDGDALVELACVDDVFLEPLGVTLQAAVTIDTDEGETYAIQVGGFWFPFGGDPQFGRIKLTLE